MRSTRFLIRLKFDPFLPIIMKNKNFSYFFIMAKNGSNFGRIKNRVDLLFFYSMRRIQWCAQIKISMKTDQVVSPAARPMLIFLLIFAAFPKCSQTVFEVLYFFFLGRNPKICFYRTSGTSWRVDLYSWKMIGVLSFPT